MSSSFDTGSGPGEYREQNTACAVVARDRDVVETGRRTQFGEPIGLAARPSVAGVTGGEADCTVMAIEIARRLTE